MPSEQPLKLLIVEDETNTRGLIRAVVDWKELGIEVSGEASTSAEALDFIEESPPDIVLTDIEMPYMSGLELCERVRTTRRDIAVIILTAHDRFEYTQEGLRHGASRYVLKPIDKPRLEQAIAEVAGEIWDRRKLLSKMELTYNYIRQRGQFFMDRALLELITKGTSDGLLETLETTGVCLAPDDVYSLAMFGIAGQSVGGAVAERYLLLSNLRSYIVENYGAIDGLYLLDDGIDRLILLSCSLDVDIAGLCMQIARSAGDGVREKLRFSVGDPCLKLAELTSVYRSLKDSLRLEIIAAERVGARDLSWRSLEELTRDLLLFIKSGLADHAEALSRELFSRYIDQFGGVIDAAKLHVIGFMSRAFDALTTAGVPWMGVITVAAPYYARIFGQKDISGLCELFVAQTLALCDLAYKRHSQNSNETIMRVVRFIEDEYSNPDLSLSLAAEKHRLNSSYLSRSFKFCVGKTFSEYLVELRIHKACEILSRDDMKAYQLAQMVGITDPNYFVKCFKKVIGISFQQYKAETTRKTVNGFGTRG